MKGVNKGILQLSILQTEKQSPAASVVTATTAAATHTYGYQPALPHCSRPTLCQVLTCKKGENNRGY